MNVLNDAGYIIAVYKHETRLVVKQKRSLFQQNKPRCYPAKLTDIAS